MKISKKDYSSLLKNALAEDLNKSTDVTSAAIFKNEKSKFILLAKDNGILCGMEIFSQVFKSIDKDCKITFFFKDKDKIKKGEIIAAVEGHVLSILKGERTALNFISHLSGIATKTALFVRSAKNKIKILDTRKTIPGLRILQKYAVHCGNGVNHRMGLFDMILIKDNHIDASGSITNAVNKVRKKWGKKFKIEVETRNLKEVEEALICKADRIMLDNMNYSLMKKSVKLINKLCEVEISGNMNLKKVRKYSKIGADFVSIGELTHTIQPFDFSLKKAK
jgi:nicotinate-nucleotide pyrophosphorylase (carboxylating)